jgi:hypothetical protein
MEDMYHTIQQYESRADEVLGYQLKGTWSAGGDATPFEFMTDKDQKTIIGSK